MHFLETIGLQKFIPANGTYKGGLMDLLIKKRMNYYQPVLKAKS